MLYEYHEDPGKEVTINNDSSLSFRSPSVQFTKRVELRNCVIKEFAIYADYFAQGIVIRDCIFECDVLWEAGGHNKGPIVFENCKFLGFVDFEDCCFDGEFILRHVSFLKGTNLFGNKNTPVMVVFETAPRLEGVTGKLDMDTYHS